MREKKNRKKVERNDHSNVRKYTKKKHSQQENQNKNILII